MPSPRSPANRWKSLLAPFLLLSAIITLAASCGGGPSGACTLETNEGCTAGQKCVLEGAVTSCVCDAAANTGCPAGKVCTADPEGAPRCLTCSLTDNAGCAAGTICIEDAKGFRSCAACSTATNAGCPTDQICIANAMGVPSCAACDTATNAGCPTGEICINDPNGVPFCAVCSTADNKGCPANQFCVAGAGGVPQCAVCTTTDNKGCPADQVCAADAMGVFGCFCNTTTKGGCPDGKVCLADPNGVPACYCATETEAGCPVDQVCEEVPNGYPTCFPPLNVRGQVFDLATTAPIAGAHVVARDANFAAVSGVAVTDANGMYTLTVPAPRNPDGTPIAANIFLRADAQTYVTFPTAPRVALPIDLSKAMGTPPLLQSSATDIGMIRLANTTGLGTVSGKVLAPVPVGTLVVAGGAVMTGGGVTGIADTDGSYTVFNVPAGSVTVKGYKVGLQLGEATANVVADMETTGVDLADKGTALSVVSGSVALVNAGMGMETSVILVVEETFVENAARGEAPPGLRAFPVTGAFSIAGVPDGNYVVLAAFENDFLVRDPDMSIGGTQIVHITVAGGDLAISSGFKVTGSLDVVSPDKEEVVSGTPKFVWKDDSGEDHYELRVFDAYGNKIWEKLDVPGVSGGQTVTVDYAGPTLTSGTLYQFRATSIKLGGTAIAVTEDLRGVFLYK